MPPPAQTLLFPVRQDWRAALRERGDVQSTNQRKRQNTAR